MVIISVPRYFKRGGGEGLTQAGHHGKVQAKRTFHIIEIEEKTCVRSILLQCLLFGVML